MADKKETAKLLADLINETIGQDPEAMLMLTQRLAPYTHTALMTAGVQTYWVDQGEFAVWERYVAACVETGTRVQFKTWKLLVDE